MASWLQWALTPRLQHGRIQGIAWVILVVRLLEGAATWGIVYRYFSPHTVDPQLLHWNFAAYGLLNVGLFFLHRRQRLTPAAAWADVLANLLPMTAAAHWSGGVYTPLLPIFVLKIGSYGLIYSADVGYMSLATATLLSAGLGIGDYLGVLPTPGVEEVSPLARARIALAFDALTFGILVGGSLQFFRVLQERDARLEELVHAKESAYRESVRHQANLRDLSRRMMQTSEDTMRRLVRELHDDLGQALTAVRMDLGMIDRELPAGSPLHARVGEARDQIAAILQSVRNLSQLLRPPVLDDLGLAAAVQWYVGRFRDRTDIDVDLTVRTPETRLPRPIEVALYRILQEALTNVSRHAQARHVAVGLVVDETSAALTVADDGTGFEVGNPTHDPSAAPGTGILGMRERVATHGGRFEVRSEPGKGTTVELTIPVTAPEHTGESHGDDPRLAG